MFKSRPETLVERFVDHGYSNIAYEKIWMYYLDNLFVICTSSPLEMKWVAELVRINEQLLIV